MSGPHLTLPRTHQNSSVLSTASFSERVRNMSPDEIKIPPGDPGRCSTTYRYAHAQLLRPCRLGRCLAGSDFKWLLERNSPSGRAVLVTSLRPLLGAGA